jgi:hypothetical protein
MSFSLSEPSIDALGLHLSNCSGLPRSQQFAVEMADGAKRRCRTDEKAFALESYDLDSSFYHRCG